MAKQDLGKIVPTFNGIYNANIDYEKLCIVNHDGSVYVSKKDIPKGTDISNEEYWYLLIEKLKKGVDYFTEEDRQAIIDEVTKLAESDFNKYYDEKKKALDKVASDNTAAFLKVVKDNTTDFNSNVDTQTKAFDTHYDEKVKSFDENSDEQTTAYNTNANNKLNDYNENHKSKIQELDNEATTKIAEYDQHSEELRNMAVSTDNELERVKNEILDTGSASDSFVHVEDSCMAKIKELEIEGVFEQETTIGKNLLNVSKNLQQIKSNSYSITPVYSNGMLKYIELNGTFDKWVKYNILGAEFTLSSGTYTQSFHKTGTFSNGSVYIDSDLLITSIESDNYTKVLSDDLNILKYNICVNEGTICNNLKLYPMVAKEGKASNYEPFTNGASPNPDYPQKIKTITDNLSVTSCNKNVFKITSALKHSINSGIDISINDNVITLNGTANGAMWPDFIWGIQGNTAIHNKCKYYFSEQLEDCIASIKVLSGTATGGSFVIVANDDSSSNFTFNFSNLQNTKTLKANGVNRAYLSGITNGTKFDNFTFEIMLEKGSVATAFERRVESQIQANLPEGEFIGKFDDTYKDIVRPKYFPEEGQYHWMLDKMVGHKTFTGNEKWIYYANAKIFYFDRVDSPIKTFYPIATHYIGGTYNTNNRILIDNNGRVHISDYRYSNVADFKNFLSNNNVEMYYPLRTPYTIDLGPIDMPLSYKKITNVFTDSDLLPTINAKYYRTFEKTVQNLQINEKSLKQEIADLNVNLADITKRLEALESANASTVEESEVSNDLQN